MRAVKWSGKFKRDFKRFQHPEIKRRLNEIVGILADDGQLPKRNHDHALIGSIRRDCHVCPDVVLLYEKPDPDTLLLLRLGSHSELFG